MGVAAVEDALVNARQGKTVEAELPPGELTMQQLSKILAGADTFKDSIMKTKTAVFA